MADTSANWWPRFIQSIACSERKPGAEIFTR